MVSPEVSVTYVLADLAKYFIIFNKLNARFKTYIYYS